MSRRLVLAAVTVVLLAAAAVAFIAAGDGGHEGAQPAAAAGIQRFLTRPELRPAAVTVKTPPSGTHPGFLFMAPKGGKSQNGPMIADGEGRLVWFSPRPKGVLADDFRVQRYRGRPVLTWWEGRTNPKGYGAGSYVIADASYHEIARVRAGNGLQGDLHEFRLTPRGTALITIYHRVPADLTAVGGKRDGTMLDSVVQEVDVATGRVRFEWHSRGHVPIAESHAKPPTSRQDFAYDYFHVNSVSLDRDGDYLVSARNTWTVYKLDRHTGRIVWRLGGKRSDFRLGPGVRFAWQHDAERQPDGTLTLFDNEATPKVGDRSRALRLRLDERRRRAEVVHAWAHPDPMLAIAEGNQQVLPDGGSFVGWGFTGRVSELDPSGRVRLDLQLPPKVDTYRAYRSEWRGRPARPPAIAVSGGKARASWNGATDVTRWQVVADGRPRASTKRTGFETALAVPDGAERVAVRALDAAGQVLGTSATIRVPGP